MATRSGELDLRGLLGEMHHQLAAALSVRPQLVEETRELAACISGIVDRALPGETEQLFRLALRYAPLWQRPLPPELLEEEGLPESAASCLTLNLRFYCSSSLQSEARLRRVAPGPGERPGLLDQLRLAPPSGPSPGLRRIENGARADFDEWLRATAPADAAEDLQATIETIAAAWLPDAAALRAWLDLLVSGSIWLADREVDVDLDELSPLICLRANLQGWLASRLREQLDQALPEQPKLQAAIHALHDFSGRDLTVQFVVALPDPERSCELAGAADPGQAALNAFSLDTEQRSSCGLRPRGASWRFQPPDELCETHRVHAARLARESDDRARFLQIELGFEIWNAAALRDLIGELHDHPGELCEDDPPPAELARQALIELRCDDAAMLGVLLLRHETD